MIYDPSKVLSVTYNHLNLPYRMEFPDCKVIEFVYDAAGSKIAKVVSQDESLIKRKDYIGGIEYKNQHIEAIYHAEGRLYFEGDFKRYEYSITDHLGNTRLSFTDRDNDGIIEPTDDSETNEILTETHYYAFGMAMEGPWMQNEGRENKYLYNGKELNEEFELGWMSYGAREFDAAIARWVAVDPLSEAQVSFSTYTYTFNNPISYIDPTGMMGEAVHANGLTTEQWIVASRPNAPEGLIDYFREENEKSKGEEERSESDKNWVGMTKRDLMGLSTNVWTQKKKEFPNLSNKALRNLVLKEMGRIFERGVLKSLGLLKNNVELGGREPDAIIEDSKYMLAFLEIKSVKNLDFTYQIEDFMDYLSTSSAKLNGGVGILHLVTLSDANVNWRKINKESIFRGIGLYHSIVQRKIDDPSIIRVAQHQRRVTPTKSPYIVYMYYQWKRNPVQLEH